MTVEHPAYVIRQRRRQRRLRVSWGCCSEFIDNCQILQHDDERKPSSQTLSFQRPVRCPEYVRESPKAVGAKWSQWRLAEQEA